MARPSRSPDRNRVAEVGAIARTAGSAALLAALLASGVGILSYMTQLDLSPRVGDILVFKPGTEVSVDWQVTATKASPANGSCVLKPDVMSMDGGSLVVEQRAPDHRTYRAHWAGPRTSAGSDDCGNSADLTLSRPELQLLINVVGGVGVERKRFPGA